MSDSADPVLAEVDAFIAEYRRLLAENQQLRDALAEIEDNSLAFHKGEEGKARAIAVMGRTARAALAAVRVEERP